MCRMHDVSIRLCFWLGPSLAAGLSHRLVVPVVDFWHSRRSAPL
jgi:hypothetical protein